MIIIVKEQTLVRILAKYDFDKPAIIRKKPEETSEIATKLARSGLKLK